MTKILVLYTLFYSVVAITGRLAPAVFGNRSVALLESFISHSEIYHFEEGFPFGSHGLLKRQQFQCNDAGYVPCPNIAGACCPAGDDCFSIGCCNSGYSPCGSRCYSPKTSVCCNGGYTCQLGYDCVGNNYCCPTGKKLCGTSTCYFPDSEKCCSEGYSCPAGHDCVGGGYCCPTGEQRCGNSKCYNPNTQTCCTSTGEVWACDADESCCSEGGATACFNPSTEQCCPGGSCGKSYSCCGKECCGSASTCGSDGYCTGQSQPTTARKTATQTAVSLPTGTASAGKTITFKYDPNRKVKGSDGELYDAQNKAILKNMCEGIKAFLGEVSQEINLTRTDPSTRIANRKAMCPPGWCANALKEYLSEFYPQGLPAAAQQAVLMAKDMSCDEFPFAISAEGGDLNRGTRICLPSAENSWQGGTMSGYFKNGGIDVGETFKVVIDGFDCESLMPDGEASKRDVNVTDIEGGSLYHGYDANSPNNNLLAMPLGDLDAGKYAVHVSVASGSLDFSVLTYDGRPIDSTKNADGTITFALTEAEDSVSLVGVTQDTTVQVSYSSKKVDTSANSASRSSGPLGWNYLAILGLAFMQFIIL